MIVAFWHPQCVLDRFLGCFTMTYDTFLVIMAFGLTGAGLVHSGWLWLGHTRPSFSTLLDGGPAYAMPVRVVAIMMAAPLILAGSAVRMADYGWRYFGLTVMGLVVSAVWCFMIGIVLLVGLDFLMTV
jgi:hypothetical protein